MLAAKLLLALVLGTIPPYPGAVRPLPAWESKLLAIAMTADKPGAVLAYYIDRLVRDGWTPEPGQPAEAMAAASAGQPAWITFSRRGVGKLDLQVDQGIHPQTGAPVTLIYYLRASAPQ
jgi:hypothetical protein